MAPIYSTSVGIHPQIIDDARLRDLHKKLNGISLHPTTKNNTNSPADLAPPFDIVRLIDLVEPYQIWLFEENVDLQEWIPALNAIDACLSYFVCKYPSILLVGSVERRKSRGVDQASDRPTSQPAESLEAVDSVPSSIHQQIKILLRFLSALLANSSNKSVFDSVEELVDFLGAADDDVASLAMEALCELSKPPESHKQMIPPEVQQHSTALHSSKTTSHKRILALARGWGSRGSGLGLYTCTTADDSEFGQGALPSQAGELNFAFFRPSATTSTTTTTNNNNNNNNNNSNSNNKSSHTISVESSAKQKEHDNSEYSHDNNNSSGNSKGDDGIDNESSSEQSHLVRITLLENEILDAVNTPIEKGSASGSNISSSGDCDEPNSKQKRRKVAPANLGNRKLKSTAELFFHCIEKVGGRSAIPDDRLFPLLADIRLTRSFYTRATRLAAIQRRLHALITALYSHPSQEIVSGYFQAQPELCIELIDLLRPSVSSASVSSAGAGGSATKQDSIAVLASSPNIPYQVRMLAVDALTALVARKDGSNGALTGVARHSSVLSELGVGKGQYLGLLPTLIRFSLASLGLFLSADEISKPEPQPATDDLALDLGRAFVEATKPPPVPRATQLGQALQFIESVLGLTSAVVATPSGTSALTDCGLIPALLTTVAIDTDALASKESSELSSEEMGKIRSLLRSITAQGVQILGTAIVTHNNAQAAFHELGGVEVLTARLSKEILGPATEDNEKCNSADEKKCKIGCDDVGDDDPMDCDNNPPDTAMAIDEEVSQPKVLTSSQRVLMFSIVTCLTVIFHQESTSSSSAAPSGGAQLRKSRLTNALKEILENVNIYGGQLASLIATLLADVMNSDPHVVHHVHKSGLATSFLKMLIGNGDDPVLPPVPEMIMVIPNVLSALALTEDGANAVKESNPFPALLKILCHPKYAMPQSRCLLNEMSAVVGQFMEEIMRHVQSLKPIILTAIADAMNDVANFGEELILKESKPEWADPERDGPVRDIENERSCLMQYASNFGQLLEQILHSEDHCEPFVDAGGLKALLRLYPCLMPAGPQFLAHASCLSCPSISTLAHSTTEDSLTLAFKCITLRYDSLKLLRMIIQTCKEHMERLQGHQNKLRAACGRTHSSGSNELDASFILDALPRKPLYEVSHSDFAPIAHCLSDYLRQVATFQWIIGLLASTIKAVSQRSQDSGTGWGRVEKEWKKELSSIDFEELVSKISLFHQSAIIEVCRIRTEDGFEEREKSRLTSRKNSSNNNLNLCYRLRIVCPEGAVVRDGIEIDSCASVGSMEMGEVAAAFDRCINSSGVLRYRTSRGWVSEQTRGHGREPIAEVLSVWSDVEKNMDATSGVKADLSDFPEGRVDIGVPDLCSASANVLARVQASYSELFSSFSRVVIQGFRCLPVRAVIIQQGHIGGHLATMMRILTSNIEQGFNRPEILNNVQGTCKSTDSSINENGAAMYLGCLLGHLHSCLFEEKRERRAVNVPLLVSLLDRDISGDSVSSDAGTVVGIFNAVQYIFKHGLTDFESRSLNFTISEIDDDSKTKYPKQGLSRTVAASLPAATSFLRRLISGPSITSSPVSSVLSRVKQGDLAKLLGNSEDTEVVKPYISEDGTFSPERFTRILHCKVSNSLREPWTDSRFIHAPPYIVHPITILVGEVILRLEEATKKQNTQTTNGPREESSSWNPFRSLMLAQQRSSEAANAAARAEEEFEPSEEAISRLTEMGFSRDHAWDALDSTRSNRVEVAMEYALSHPPPSPSAIQQRMTEREARRQQREDQQATSSSSAAGDGANDNDNSNIANSNNDGPDRNTSANVSAGNEQNTSTARTAGGNEDESTANMDVDVANENKETKINQDKTSEDAKSNLEDWKKQVSKVACDILAGTGSTDETKTSDGPYRVDSGKGEGDGDVEALTVVLCSFLLDLCRRYPDKRDEIVVNILKRTKQQMMERKIGDAAECMVLPGRESSFAALCHATVLFTRALPRTRTLVLQEGLVHCVISCIQVFQKSNGDQVTKWPMWLAPSLLLLDIMAQPVVAFTNDDESNTDISGNGDHNDADMTVGKEELNQVREEHKKLSSALSKMAKTIFSALRNSSSSNDQNSKDNPPPPLSSSSSPPPPSSSSCDDVVSPKPENQSKLPDIDKETSTTKDDVLLFENVPSYFPLIVKESSDACVQICLDLLTKKPGLHLPPPPGVIHAGLSLLTRILRDPKMSNFCLKSGVAELVLALPHECRFNGNSGLVMLIFRRLLEDESTLQAAMESEIRSAVAKLYEKQKNGSTDNKDKPPSVSRRSFIQAITPLLCRDPVSFLKAVAVSVHVEKNAPTGPNEAKVTLLTPAERARNLKIVTDATKAKQSTAIPQPKPVTTKQRRSSDSSRHKKSNSNHSPRSKTPTRGSLSRRSSHSKKKKDKSDKLDDSSHLKHNATAVTSSPSNHLTALLINHIVSTIASQDKQPGDEFLDTDFGYRKSFLWVGNVLEILADLVLAVPACAVAIYKHKFSRERGRAGRNIPHVSVSHALQGCQSPTKSFISYLLHALLPQDRWNIRKDQQIWDHKSSNSENKLLKDKKQAAFRKSKVAQASARLLVALVARPGEGRKRVVAELAFALSFGLIGHNHVSSSLPALPKGKVHANELHALQAWGELCIGLAAPRSNGNNYDGNSSLSFEVVKIMLEHGMAHALLVAMHRVPLHHPMATSVCGSLILPFEILSRSSVFDAVKGVVEKEEANKDSKEASKSSKNGPSNDAKETPRDGGSGEGEDDPMVVAGENDIAGHGLDEGFVMDRTEAHDQDVRFLGRPAGLDGPEDEENDAAMVMEGVDDGDDEDVSGDDHGADDDGMSSSESDSEGSSEESDGDDDDDDDDDDNSDSENESDDGDDDDDDEEEDGASILDGSDGIDSDDDVELGGFGADYPQPMMLGDGDEFEAEENGTDHVESALDEGWTRIESAGFGGMILGGGNRRGVPRLTAATGGLSASNRNFMDAAEAMIGTLLRTGEIPSEALAEIEGSLGIRIMHNGMGLDFGSGTGRGEGFMAEALTGRQSGSDGIVGTDQSRRGEIVGTLPHINQRSQPDVGYTALSGGGRWNEIGSMEYVFGGPSVTAGSRSYDLVSPVTVPVEDEASPNITQIDGLLFPGGPASAAHARAQHSLHPLLCGVDLPPVNALVSDLLPHGVRSTRQGRTSIRRGGEWSSNTIYGGSFLVSTSTGNIIRSNRTHNSPFSMVSSNRNVFGPVGWTDDGLPFDATVEDFSAAFGRALGESMSVPVVRSPGTQQSAPSETIEQDDNGGNDGDRPQQNAEDRGAASGQGENVDNNSQTSSGNMVGESPDLANGDPQPQLETNNNDTPATETTAQEGSQEEDNHNDGDGDGVASSLAAGLRLSPPGEPSPGEANGDGDEQATDNDVRMSDAGDGNGDPPEDTTAMEVNSTSENETDVAIGHQVGDTMNEHTDAAQDASGNPSNNDVLVESQTMQDGGNVPNGNGLICPPGMDLEVFNSLPFEMQQEVVEQARTAEELAAQLDSTSALDPEALAALPEDMRREVIEQEQQERRLREQAPADPSNAEEMDNASFVASLSPDLRQEILVTADDAFLQSLPPNIIAEAQILRERASVNRRIYEETSAPPHRDETNNANAAAAEDSQHHRNAQGSTSREQQGETSGSAPSRRKHRSGKIRVECDRDQIVYIPPNGPLEVTQPVSVADIKMLLCMLYLLSPVRPHRLIQRLFQNLCGNPKLRQILSSVFVRLLHDDNKGALTVLEELSKEYTENDWRKLVDTSFSDLLKEFPPLFLIGAAPDVLETEGFNPSITLARRKHASDTAASIASSLPTTARGSRHEQYLPPVVATRLIDSLQYLCKNSPRFCLDTLVIGVLDDNNGGANTTATCFEKLLDLLDKPRYSKSSANLEQLLTLLESAVSPLSHLSKHGEDDFVVSQREIESAASAGKEWVDVPRITVSQERLQLLCSILRMETCRDVSFTKVNTIARRLCRVEANRGYVLAELASVAQALGADAIRDLKALSIRMSKTAERNQERNKDGDSNNSKSGYDKQPGKYNNVVGGSATSSVAVSSSTSELKLLRVLQTLQALCLDTSDDSANKKGENGPFVTEELVHLLRAMNLGDLWDELTSCLKIVQVLEGVSTLDVDENKMEDDNDGASVENGPGGKKLQNSVAGLLTRFLPSIEAFFVANASVTRGPEKANKDDDHSNKDGTNAAVVENIQGGATRGHNTNNDIGLENLVGGNRVVEFVGANRVLLNALVRNNAGLLEKGLKVLVQVPRCRGLLDFDVKRHWFKTQMRRLRQHASRRHGSLRLHIRRKHVFEDAYHQLRLRTADEMRGRLHITFRNEEGVDAGGLSREFFGILAKEIFNPNYALFTSTEDGCTFQPNPNSSINSDHLSYFRFVGRIVGKAVADGYLLDAHFTRSLYKHMLGIKPTHHDMEAIDPDYYKNLKTILEFNLGDLGLELTFATEDHSFGRNQSIDLIPNGRAVPVTEENKEKYVSLICQHRMTKSIASQIKAYLDGFYELVSPDLIAIFTPRELELLISGLPDIDVHDLKQNTDYVGWKATDKQIEWFWNVVFSLSRNEKAAFLQFVTGSSKVPLAGFSELPGMRGVQKFSIHKTGGPDGALMSAHTCFNSLDLPAYNSEDELREKLLYAINEGGGAFMFA